MCGITATDKESGARVYKNFLNWREICGLIFFRR